MTRTMRTRVLLLPLMIPVMILLIVFGGCASSGGPGAGDEAGARSGGERDRPSDGADAAAADAASSGAADADAASPGAAGADAASRRTATEAEEAAVAQEYRIYVANESSDIISRVVFRPGEGAEVESEIPIGIMPADNDGAHGLIVSPDGEFFYVTLAHGTPYGYLWKYHAGPDTLAGRTTLGQFPASVGTTPDGQFVVVGNFNLHGDMVPSDVSFVYAPTMTEVSRITTCLMPHGSRVNVAGTKQYSTCMHSDQVVEIDLTTFQISSRFSVLPGAETTLALDDRGEQGAAGMDHAGMDGMDDAEHEGMMGQRDVAVCSPTWVEPGKAERADRYVYVACNKTDEVLEVDVSSWRITRRFETGAAPYNLNTTHDGRHLIATLKGDQGVSIIGFEEGREVARISTSEPITHGVTSSPDSRFAFVSNESIGSTPGTMDVFDLERMERIASVELRHQSSGIDFWRMTPSGEAAENGGSRPGG